MTWAGGRNLCGTPILSFFPFSVYLNVKPIYTHSTFTGVAVLHCWNVLHVCNSYCVSDPLHWWNSIDRNFCPLFQSLLVALWQLKGSIRCKSSITTYSISDIWTPKYVSLGLGNIFSVLQTSRKLQRGVNWRRGCTRNLCADVVSGGPINRRTEKNEPFWKRTN